jgi:hypothetical protein
MAKEINTGFPRAEMNRIKEIMKTSLKIPNTDLTYEHHTNDNNPAIYFLFGEIRMHSFTKRELIEQIERILYYVKENTGQ